MPMISNFYGIVVLMYWQDHNPPHFPVQYAGYKAAVGIAERRLIRGSLPDRAERFVLEWAELHQAELTANCERRVRNIHPELIEALP